MALKDIKSISTLVRWIDDTYKFLLPGVNAKEDVWCITTRVIRSVFEDFLSPARSTASKNSFDSDYQRRSTLIWEVIKGHLTADKILEKFIKDHPVVVGAYAQWLVSKSVRKESIDANIMANKLKEKLDELTSSYSSS